MKRLMIIPILISVLGCKKTSQPPAVSSIYNNVTTTTSNTATITYKLSVKHIAPNAYFINYYNVYGSTATLRDCMIVASKSYSFTAKQGAPNKYMYLFQWEYMQTNANQADSITLQILLNGVVKRDTTVDGWSGGDLILYY